MPQPASSNLSVLTRGNAAFSPFVGNAALVGVLTHAARGAALVVGEAGAGKSRLLAEAARRRAAAGTDVVAVACLPAAAQIAFDPLIALTKSLCARGRLSPRAQRAVAATSEPHRMQHVCEAFERAASAAPLALQIDDLHWADPHTLQAMHYCIDRLRDLPLVWTVAARPGHAGSDELGAVLARAHQADVIELDGLSIDDVGAFVRALAPDLALDDATIERLHERSGGNPLYLELLLHDRDDETVPALRRALDERVRAFSPDALDVAGTIAEQDVPLNAAALAARARLPGARITAALAALVGDRVLRRIPGGYAFRHGLLRDACRAARGDACPAHEADLVPKDGRSATEPPWADAPWSDAALTSLERAVAGSPADASGELAQQLYVLGTAYDERDELQRARDALDRGIACCDGERDEALMIRLRARRAAVKGRLGNPQEGIAVLEGVTERAAASGLHDDVARCCVELCALSEMIADPARYERWCRFGLAAAGSRAGAARTALLVSVAQVALGKGQLREALALAGAASAAAEAGANPVQRCRALCMQAHVSAMLGEFDAATQFLAEAAALAPHPRAQSTVALASAVVAELHGDMNTALGAYSSAAGDGRHGHRDVGELVALAGIVRCACALGMRLAAQDAVEQLRATSRLGWTVARRLAHEADGCIALLDGDAARGCAELVRATELGQEPFWRARSLLRVADARKDRKLFLGVIESFDAMDAAHAADAARTAARAHGLRPGRKRESQNALSAREGSVALLVASGMTNSEIGELLHITSRTAEYHVGNILTKWGLRSRVEVAARVASGRARAGD